MSEAVASLLAEPGVRVSTRMAWQPQAPVAGGEAAGGGKSAGEVAAAGEAAGEAEGGGKSAELVFSRPPPPLRTFAARVPERQDRKAAPAETLTLTLSPNPNPDPKP